MLNSKTTDYIKHVKHLYNAGDRWTRHRKIRGILLFDCVQDMKCFGLSLEDTKIRNQSLRKIKMVTGSIISRLKNGHKRGV